MINDLGQLKGFTRLDFTIALLATLTSPTTTTQRGAATVFSVSSSFVLVFNQGLAAYYYSPF